MKKIWLLLIVTLFLTACGEEKEREVIKEDSFAVREISYEYDSSFWDGKSLIYIDTDQETFVLSTYEVEFIKTDKETSLKKKIIYDNRRMNPERTEFIMYVNEDEVSKISKEYAKTFERTLNFRDE